MTVIREKEFGFFYFSDGIGWFAFFNDVENKEF
jgi:hypothetical protein